VPSDRQWNSSMNGSAAGEPLALSTVEAAVVSAAECADEAGRGERREIEDAEFACSRRFRCRRVDRTWWRPPGANDPAAVPPSTKAYVCSEMVVAYRVYRF
jgi:hypothetical protein